MRKTATKPNAMFDDYSNRCSFTGKNEAIVAHYVHGKTKQEKEPRSFRCFSNPNCQNKDNCPLWVEYCDAQKYAQFRLAHL